MKIHLLAVCRFNPFTVPFGTEVFMKNLALELIKQGHEVEVLYGTLHELSKKIKSKHVTSIRQHEINLSNVASLHVRALRVIEFCVKYLDLYKHAFIKSDIDVVLWLGAFGALIGSTSFFLRSLKPRPIFIYYAMDCRLLEYRREMPLLISRGLSRELSSILFHRIPSIVADRLSCHNSDLLLASSRDTATALNVYYKVHTEKIRVLYEGVPDNYAKGFEASEPKTPIFLHISTIPERKGTTYFLKALKILQEKYNLEAQGIITNATERFYMNMAKNLKVNASFVGKVSEKELKRLYASSTCLVSPSLSEGFCLPVIEAAMFGKPSIVSNVGSLPELVRDGVDGYVVPVYDVGSLAEKMYELATEDELRRHMSMNAREKAEKFKMSSVASNFVHIIREALDKRR